MLRFLVIFITRLLVRFVWIGVGFAVAALFGRGLRTRQVRTSLWLLRKLGRF